jgi:hypothetical protein
MRAAQGGNLTLDEDIDTYLPFKVINPHQPNEKLPLILLQCLKLWS